MSGRKPMSSIRSASSRTTILSDPQVERAAADQVEHPARRADDDVGALLQLGDLAADRLAAVHRHAGSAPAVGQLLDLVADLHGQFARRHQHQRLRRAALLAAHRAVRGSESQRRRSCRCRCGPGPARRLPASARGMRPACTGVGYRYSARSSDASIMSERPSSGKPFVSAAELGSRSVAVRSLGNAGWIRMKMMKRRTGNRRRRRPASRTEDDPSGQRPPASNR